MKQVNLFISVSLLLLSTAGEAKMFRNAYLAFDLPEGWNCILEATEWLCRSAEVKSSREAIIIFTAKEAGPTDSFPIYEQTINTERNVSNKAGKNIPSKVILKVKQVRINDQLWVDGMQKGSEIPNYFTRYLATIKEKIAILVTFSAHAEYFAKYSTDFFKAIQSLRVVASKSLLAQPSGSSSSANTSGVWGAASTAPGGAELNGEAPFSKKRKSSNSKINYILFTLGGLLVGSGGYFYIRSRKRN